MRSLCLATGGVDGVAERVVGSGWLEGLRLQALCEKRSVVSHLPYCARGDARVMRSSRALTTTLYASCIVYVLSRGKCLTERRALQRSE